MEEEASNQGAVYVFQRPSGDWVDATQTARLSALGADNLLVGSSVAIADDTVLAGGPGTDVLLNTDQGSVYLFDKPEGGWTDATPTASLTTSDGAAGDQVGRAMAVSGEALVVSAPLDDFGAVADQGSAYVFQRSAGGDWADAEQIAKLTASAASSRLLGYTSVAIAGDTIVAGSPFDSVGSKASQGSAYVFQKPAGGWTTGTQTARLMLSGGSTRDWFGYSVAAVGDTVVVGASGKDVANENQGSVYVFGPNQPPSCTGVSASPSLIAPATREMTLITLAGASDPDGDTLSFRIDGVTQDEPVMASAVGDETSPDAQLTAAGADSNQVHVRAERNPQLNGRVYRIAYTVSDGKGGRCSGTAGVGGDTNAEVSVPRKRGETAVDDGDTNSWDSFTGNIAHART